MAYSELADINNVYGSYNVIEWSDLNGTSTLDSTRIAAAIAWADETINSRLRSSVYAVPLPSGNVKVTDWSATLAGWWLYRSRGLRDSAELDKLRALRADVLEELSDVSAGVLELDAPMSAPDDPTCMTIVT